MPQCIFQTSKSRSALEMRREDLNPLPRSHILINLVELASMAMRYHWRH